MSFLTLIVIFGFVLQASTIDGRRKGACLFCQEYFMDLYLLAELKTISLKVSKFILYLLIFSINLFLTIMTYVDFYYSRLILVFFFIFYSSVFIFQTSTTCNVRINIIYLFIVLYTSLK